jgi:hypothetical protein
MAKEEERLPKVDLGNETGVDFPEVWLFVHSIKGSVAAAQRRPHRARGRCWIVRGKPGVCF